MKRETFKLQPTFGKQWAAMLWEVMTRTGNGYRKHSLRNTGKGDDRRQDKLDFKGPQSMRRYQQRYQCN